MNILFAADGSDYTKRAARHLVEHLQSFAKPATLHVLYVHPELPLLSAGAIVGKKAVEKYYREESEAALEVAEKIFRKAGIACQAAWRVGDAAKGIAGAVKKHRVDLVVMGSHGHGAIKGLVLGSVATKVIAAVKVPVLIVR